MYTFLIMTVLFFLMLGMGVLFVYSLYALLGCFSLAPFVATPEKIVRQMIDMGHVHVGSKVVELGSGNGIIALHAATKGATVIGVEINPVLVAYSQFRAWRKKLEKQITFYRKSVWDFQIPRDTDVVLIYGLPSFMPRIWKKMEVECRPGTLLISHAFTVPGKMPIQREGSVLVYQV